MNLGIRAGGARAVENAYLLKVRERDLYDVLGVSADASAAAIKAVYRQLARTFHPDVNADVDAVEHFREITQAFIVLTDPEQRKAYDRHRRPGRLVRNAQEETETYLGLRVAGIDLGGVLGVSVRVRRRTLLPDEPEEAPVARSALRSRNS
jgi:curved DNA-binding protein CbpA